MNPDQGTTTSGLGGHIAPAVCGVTPFGVVLPLHADPEQGYRVLSIPKIQMRAASASVAHEAVTSVPHECDGLNHSRGLPMALSAPDPQQLSLRHYEPDPIPELEAELIAEVARLTAGADGESEIERIYLEYSGPVTRRKALLRLSAPRMGKSLSHQIRGAIELTAICRPHRVTLEVSWAPNANWLRDGACAQRDIDLPLLRAERGQPEAIPNGQPEGTW